MSKNLTVFVLGAGASKPFGLPTGDELVRNLCSKSAPLMRAGSGDRFADSTRDDLERQRQFEHLSQFMAALRGSGMCSIDVFSAHNPRFANTARQQIARMLVPAEHKAITNGVFMDDWHRLFINQVALRFDQLADMPYRFISFNYDRLFELSLL